MPPRRSLALLACLAALAVLAACRAAPGAEPRSRDVERAVGVVLDELHAAASVADGARYFACFAPDAVFLGTDAGERWTLAQFRAYCEPYFARGQGWTYACRERHVASEGALAWFDERLWNEKYGDCRGTGVLRRDGGAWRIVHYSLTLLVPNERAGAVVEVIRAAPDVR
jgi:hypothetical protein